MFNRNSLLGLLAIGIAYTAVASTAASNSATQFQVPDDPAKVTPLKVGTTIPTVTVRNPDGTDRSFGPASIKKPTVLIFYRGGWCPYCNAHLGELKTAEPALLELGYELVFMSADQPDLLYSSLKEPDIHYTLLSDARMNAARAYGVAFRVDDATYTRYKSFGIDLEAASGETHHELPVPAVFIINTRGVIEFEYANPDYKVRLKSDVLVAEARRLAEATPPGAR
ncbi:MAG: AhpC/TSA family protein [Steroidobacteraceae bacterium]|nr:AhpC/TSA family protein [Steroidobacteraceae bacterium]